MKSGMILRTVLLTAWIGIALSFGAAAQTVEIGETAVLTAKDSRLGNYLIAQEATLSQSATIQSMSFYVTAASGELVLGVYSANGPSGGPGTLEAQTAAFTPSVGWNVASTTTTPVLSAGKYWLAFLPSSNGLSSVFERNSNCRYYALTFTTTLPQTFSTKPTSCTPTTWSLYATLATTTTPPTLQLSDSPSSPSVPANAAVGTVVTALTASWSNGTPFTGTLSFASPYNSDGGLFALSGSNVVVNGSLASLGGTTQEITVQANSSVSLNIPIAVPSAGAASPGGDPTAGLLPSDRSAYANWTMSGLQSVGGIPNRTTVCATLSPSGGNDSTAIQNAVNACPSGEVVLLKAGTFTISEGSFVSINKSITVRGSGPCAGVSGAGTAPYPATPSMTGCTLIQRSGGATLAGGDTAGSSPTPHFVMGATDQYGNLSLGTATNLAVDGAQGSSTIQVASTTGFSVGQIVLLDEASNFGWQTSWIWPGETQWSPPDYRLTWRAQNPTCQGDDKDCSGGSTAPSIPCYFNYNNAECNYYTSEIKQIASIGAGPCPGTNCTITFNSPVMIAYRIAHSAHVAPLYGGLPGSNQGANPPVTYAGLESMTLQNADGGSVTMGACAYCWIKNEEDTIYLGYYTRGSIGIVGGFRDQLEEVYTHKGVWPAPGGAGYNWSIDLGSSEILVENSISMQADKVDVMREGGAGSVIAYNYFDESICGGCSGETEDGMNASHWLGDHHVLFEGNWTYQASSDPVWGSQNYITFMRNLVTGFRTPFYDYYDGFQINDFTDTPGTVAYNGITGVQIVLGDYWYSFIGNVIGTPGQMSGWIYNTDITNDRAIWDVGTIETGDGTHFDLEVWSQQSNASACVSASGDQCPMIRYGNYDYLNNAIADPASPVGTIPNSFYTSTEPAFFSTGSGYTWPWVTPTGSSQIQTGPTTSACTTNVGGRCSGLPAKARMDNGTPFVQP